MSSATVIQPHFLDPLPGQFAIRTSLAEKFVTARLGGDQSIDALITTAQSVGPTEKFSMEGFLQGQPTQLKTSNGWYITALDGGGIGAGSQDQSALLTDITNSGRLAWFGLNGPNSAGLFTLTTASGYYVTAVGGGGKATRAFHTDAKAASTWEQFYVTKIGDLGALNYYAIRPIVAGYPTNTASMPYLTATGGGGSTALNAVAASHSLGLAGRFRLIQQLDGSYAMQTSNGLNYVTADQGGGLAHGSTGDGDLQTNRTIVQAWEQFKFHDQGNGLYTIQTSSGFYIGLSNDLSTISTRISFPDQAPSIGYSAYFELILMNPALPI